MLEVGFGMDGIRGGGDCGEVEPAGRLLGNWKVCCPCKEFM